MSTFDDPFDADRELSRTGCVCGHHRSAAEHDHAALALRCEPVASTEERYEGVVASAVMRAMFPKDAARRAFLKSVGASTALAAISQFFPLKTATEAFAQAGSPEKKDLKVGFIPITCATPIIMGAPLGFYARHGIRRVVRGVLRAARSDRPGLVRKPMDRGLLWASRLRAGTTSRTGGRSAEWSSW